LSRSDILEARKILQKLYLLIKEMEAARRDRKGVDDIRQIARQQVDLTNSFYSSNQKIPYQVDWMPKEI
uniref:V-type ATP synthase subunit D n=1 Tax=Anisakis simplex TaxID=6269 RepID=A0A0M3JL74_ANISI